MLFDIPSPQSQSQQDLLDFARVSPAPSGPRYWAPQMISHQNRNTTQKMTTTNRRSSCDGATPQASPSPLSSVSRISPRRHVSTSCVLTVTSPNHHHHSGLRSAPFSPETGGNNSSKNTNSSSSHCNKSSKHAMMTVPFIWEMDDATESTACSTEPSESPNSSLTDEEIDEETMLLIDMSSTLTSSDSSLSSSSSHNHCNNDSKKSSPDSPSLLRRTSSICQNVTVAAGPPPVRNNTHSYNESRRCQSIGAASSTTSSKPLGQTGGLRRTNSGILRRESSLLLTPRDKPRALMIRSKSVRFGSVTFAIDMDSSNHSRNRMEIQKDCTTAMTTDDVAPTPSAINDNDDNGSSSPRSLSSHFLCQTSSSSTASSAPDSQTQQPLLIQEEQYSVDQFEQQRVQRRREQEALLDYVLMSQVSLRAQRKAKSQFVTSASSSSSAAAAAATTAVATRSNNDTTTSATKPSKAPLRGARSWLSWSPQKPRNASSFSSSSLATTTTSQSLPEKPSTIARTATSTIITNAPTAMEQEQSLSSSLLSPKRVSRGLRRYSSAKPLWLGFASK